MTDQTTRPNAELAYRVLDHIDADPESWNQQEWWCGTSGCFAGWTVKLSGDDPNRYWGSTAPHPPEGRIGEVGDRAAEVLGFDNEDRMDETAHALADEAEDRDDVRLFDSYNTRDDLGRIVALLFGPRPITKE